MIIDGHVHLTRPLSMLLEGMNAAGVDRAVVCSAGLAEGETITDLATARLGMDRIARAGAQAGYGADRLWAINEGLAAAVKASSGRIGALGKLDLHLPDEVVAHELEHLRDLGLWGVGETVGLHGRVERLEPVLRALSNAPRPVLPVWIHGDYPMDADDLEQVLALARGYPAVPIVIGHLGGDHWIPVIDGARRLDHVYLDTSEAVNLVAVRVAAAEMPDRLLFGSDFPWEDPRVALMRVGQVGLESPALQRILGQNALALWPNL
ncbi:MAG TPA: amidohydrolase family protein [Bacillota bacterium]|jgi:hypothetical protein